MTPPAENYQHPRGPAMVLARSEMPYPPRAYCFCCDPAERFTCAVCPTCGTHNANGTLLDTPDDPDDLHYYWCATCYAPQAARRLALTYALTVLRRGQELLTPETWTQRALARDAEGMPVPPLDPRAVCWCAVGILYRANGTEIYEEPISMRALATALRALYGYGNIANIAECNDKGETTYEGIKTALAHAITLVRGYLG